MGRSQAPHRSTHSFLTASEHRPKRTAVAFAALFIALIIACFRGLGRALRDETESTTGFFIWAMGASFSAHCVAFISITYFDQTIVVWYWLLAAIACLGATESVSRGPAPAVNNPTMDRASSALTL